MTATYAFTDYHSQGQTIPHVLVDITSPPSGVLNLFNLYVALSRNKAFQVSHSPELLAEDDRLQELDVKTKKWWQDMGRDVRTAQD
ncbi:hypothetical protein PAXINDRAFT_84687 [Paxillus involutus ATCC 200175]|uniref:Uncharacterized protein n=1 Tax=Paxillus involutus ATCC 200175 TaxID=664439 RepID=A0A0C9TVI3_PAXIN|nr:hypothetical protein PAXINDRAFT_84687 [Paxillus involutus ATCC 200175]